MKWALERPPVPSSHAPGYEATWVKSLHLPSAHESLKSARMKSVAILAERECELSSTRKPHPHRR